MTAICQGAAGNFTNLINLRADLVNLIGKSKQKVKVFQQFLFHQICNKYSFRQII